jgi:signal transduction histidine kinase/ligand-binding sensor domain-containing protein
MLTCVAHELALSQDRKYFITEYTTEDGLSDNYVQCIVRDGDGFVWIGTGVGLNRFDGYDFAVYRSVGGDSTSLPSNSITNLFVDHSGRLWVSTALGLCYYDRATDAFVRVPLAYNGVVQKEFEASMAAEDANKTLWFGTIGNGLARYDPKLNRLEALPAPGSSPFQKENRITGCAFAKDGTLWVSTFSNVMHYSPETNSYEKFPSTLRGGAPHELLTVQMRRDPVHEHILWLGTWANGLVRFNTLDGNYTRYKLKPDVSNNLTNIVFDMYARSSTEFWVTTEDGLWAFDLRTNTFAGRISDVSGEFPLILGTTRRIYQDAEGIIWISSEGGVVNIHPARQHFEFCALRQGPPSAEIHVDANEGKVYAVAYYANRRLIVADMANDVPERHYPIPFADSLLAEPFLVFKDSRGTIWIGTTRGICRFDLQTERFTWLELDSPLGIENPPVYVTDILESTAGALWFATRGRGVISFDPREGKLSQSKPEGAWENIGIRNLVEGPDGKLWLTTEAGVASYDPRSSLFDFFNSSVGYAVLDRCQDLTFDNNGNLWITTGNNGLCRLTPERKLTTYTEDDAGKPLVELGSIVFDNYGKLWFTSSYGLYAFDIREESFDHLTQEDGLPVRKIEGALTRGSEGRIYFHTARGIVRFDPSDLVGRGKPMPVHFTGVMVNGARLVTTPNVDLLDTLTLSYWQNNITFNFVAINVLNPSGVIYSYRLDGIDDDWVNNGPYRTLNYARLPPGTYTLRIRAANTKGLGPSMEKVIVVRIIPAWWQTRLFRYTAILLGACVILFGGWYVLSIRYKQRIARLKRQREIESIRMRMSRDIHDEIGSGLTKIKLMTRNLSRLEDNDSIKAVSDRIQVTSEDLIRELGEIVWTINPDNDTLANVTAFMRSYLAHLFEDNPGTRLQLDFPEPDAIPRQVILSPELKRNLLLILKEAVTNIVKHSRASEIRITLRVTKSSLELIIQDNGVGFESSEQNGGFGNGLRNMHKRAEAIGATFNISSIRGSGTTIRLEMPLKPSGVTTH